MAASYGWNPTTARRSEAPLDRRAKLLWMLAGLGAGALLISTITTAWVCDDAWFSLRSAWHLVNGHGLVFNPGERVQAFTSPLWTIAVAVPMWVGVPAFTAATVLSLICAAATAILLLRSGARGPGAATLAMVLLLGSKAYVDYSTSGLENPLIHLLYLAFLIHWSQDPHLHPRWLGLLTSLLLLTRPDLALLVLPHLAMLLLGAPGLRRWIDVAVGMIPLLVWELFSLVYYGALVPNTAIAKLGDAGLSRELLVERGLAYLHEGLTLDPLTLPLIALGVVLAVAGPRRSTMPTAAGVLLYLAYVVWIGGDFMAGRFLAAPMLGAVFIITQRPWWERLRWLAPAAAAALLALVLRPAMPSPFDPDYHALLDARGTMTPHQVADERAVYQQRFGLWVRWKQGELAQEQVDGPHDLIVFEEVAGWNAFIAGPGCHVVNPYGLSDPLVARMPADPPGQERAGHVTRTIPPRYLDSLRTGENLLEDPDQHALLDDLWSATRAPLSDPDRPAAILRLLRPR